MIIDGKEYVVDMDGRTHHCALDVSMHFFGGKWKTVLLWYLRKNTLRFGELKKHVPGITEKMLSLQLKELEKDGIVQRTVYAEVPPRVEYSLTEEGQTLLPVLEELAAWGRMRAGKYGKLRELVKSMPSKKEGRH
jgi:DNA-binding HxlR family transcriptional regulator